MSENFPIMFSSYRADDVLGAVRKGGQHVVVVSLPWAMIAPFEAAAHANHGQSLKGLAGRGGLAASEALAVLERRKWRGMTDADAHQQLAARLNAFLALIASDKGGANGRGPEETILALTEAHQMETRVLYEALERALSHFAVIGGDQSIRAANEIEAVLSAPTPDKGGADHG